ncbi:protein C10-like [Artemia franciscana]|uniref:protein C10-like n=1 Tax=Artemia franciscana TaxID=6661 RepID=UPI0032DBD123
MDGVNSSCSYEKIKAVLLDMVACLESHAQLRQRNIEADMFEYMLKSFPEAVALQMEILRRHDFPGDSEGTSQFLQLASSVGKEDPEIQTLLTKVRSLLLPPVNYKNCV